MKCLGQKIQEKGQYSHWNCSQYLASTTFLEQDIQEKLSSQDAAQVLVYVPMETL